MERALGDPALVLCSGCLASDAHEERWLPLRCHADETLLVRDVCVHPHCPQLQVRGHLCVAHLVEKELLGQSKHLNVRTCAGCRVSTLQLYRRRRDVWFILEDSEHAVGARGVERRVQMPTSSALDASVVRTRGADRRRRDRQNMKPPIRRKTSRLAKQKGQKEQMFVHDTRRLWRDNQKRSETESHSTALSGASAAEPATDDREVDGNARPAPQEVFCVIAGCTRYAKTGKCCRFHALDPLVCTRPRVDAEANGSTAVLAK
ncbi:unnamed protein product [Hyaloperonospora brassicae]|uniref:C3H1-type domain-containing protein n=1 Tax=Hyaloperonospora brassicae TaxID=162125 RepID=A0AAV0TDN1_HYABA|nr:unnamed protein product [Hyaloperonospora brassicae]